MRYVEFDDGTVMLAPRMHYGHRDLLHVFAVNTHRRAHPKECVSSAGFLGARYSEDEKWLVYGSSVGLQAKCNELLVLPKVLYVGLSTNKLCMFSSSKDAIKNLSDVVEAKWGMSIETEWGSACPVYTPFHPDRLLDAEEILRD